MKTFAKREPFLQRGTPKWSTSNASNRRSMAGNLQLINPNLGPTTCCHSTHRSHQWRVDGARQGQNNSMPLQRLHPQRHARGFGGMHGKNPAMQVPWTHLQLGWNPQAHAGIHRGDWLSKCKRQLSRISPQTVDGHALHRTRCCSEGALGEDLSNAWLPRT